VKLIECVPNFSEGRRRDVIEAIAAGVRGVEGAKLLDVHSDPDHNRSVMTLIGEPEAAGEAAFRAVARASELIDLQSHRGEHPRMGAADVVPFVPLRGAIMDECADLARSVGRRIGEELDLPVYLYGHACQHCRGLEKVRCQFETLAAEIALPHRSPDFGPKQVGKAGAVAVGARELLVAFNVNLATEDAALAKGIASKIRASDGGLPGVKALGFWLKSRGCVQVSTCITDYRKAGLQAVFAAVEKEARAAGVRVLESELVGLAPRAALNGVDPRALRLTLSPEKVLEARLR